MSATRILWGQIACILTILLITTWAATQWTAWRLGYQPQLGRPWFELAPGIPIYRPPAFFWWWFAYDAYAPGVFVEGACVAASGGIISIIVAFALLLELVIHSVGIRSTAGQCGSRLSGVCFQSRGFDACDSAGLVIIRRVAADADGAEQGGAVQN